MNIGDTQQVRPEIVLLDHRFQIPIGCGDNPHIDADSPGTAHGSVATLRTTM
jgi:hypothetical protein